MLPKLRKQIYVNYFMKNKICKLNYVNQNKTDGLFKIHRIRKKKTLSRSRCRADIINSPAFSPVIQ